MRIFYICYENLRLQRASTTHIKEVTEHLKKAGNEIILFAPDIGKYESVTAVRVVYVPTLKVKFFSEYFYYISLLFYLLVFQIKSKADVFYLREMGLSVVPAFVGFIFGVPHILEINGIPSVDLQNIGASKVRPKICRFFQHINFTLAHRVVTINAIIKSELCRTHNKLYKVSVIENGVNTSLFYPKNKEEVRRQLGLEPHAHYLIFLGSFYPHHGIHRIIRIFKEVKKNLPDARLIMVGAGYLLGSAMSLTENLGLTSHVDFAGEVGYEKAPDYINAADVGIYLLAGVGKINGRSALKLYEYLACGRPVIADESYRDFIGNNNVGIVVPEDDARLAAHAIITLLKDSALMNTMGQNGRRLVVDSFTWEITARKILDVCREL